MNALRLAFGLLTAIRLRQVPDSSRRSAGAAMLLAPLTTVPMAVALLAGHLLIAHVGSSALLVAGLLAAAEALLTRCLHLDGLADTADGLSAGYDPPSSLRAMKASDVGPSGVAALALALLVQTAALAALLPTVAGAVLALCSWVVSRHVLAWLCRDGVPAAQPAGLGAMVAGSVGVRALAGAGAVVCAAVVSAGLLAGAGWWAAVLVPLAGVGAALALERRCRRRLGGISGDVLGAAVEVSRAAALVVAALALAWSQR